MNRACGLLIATSLILTHDALAENAKEADLWSGLRFLMGSWNGVGTGAPGEGVGGFTLLPDLDGKVIVRRNHAAYPAKPGEKAGTTHDDLMVIYPDGAAIKANYFDNEGHVINYIVTTAPATATFESPESSKGSRFKLVYELHKNGELGIVFSICPPGGAYKTYITAAARKV